MVVWCTSPLPIAKTSKNVTLSDILLLSASFLFLRPKGKPLTGPTEMVPVQARRGNRKYVGKQCKLWRLDPCCCSPKANRSLAVYWPHRPVSSQILRAHTFHDTNAESHATLIPLSKTKQIYKVCSPSSARCREPGKIIFFLFFFCRRRIFSLSNGLCSSFKKNARRLVGTGVGISTAALLFFLKKKWCVASNTY